MRNWFLFISLIAVSSCCKYRITPATIEFKFEGFAPSMRQVTVISLENGFADTSVLNLDGNNKALFRIYYSYIDSIYITDLIPVGDISLSAVKMDIKKVGSGGCGGPPDKRQISFIYRDSVYLLSEHHSVIIRR